MSADAMPLPCNQQKCVGKTPISDFTKKPQSDRPPTTLPKAWGNVDSSSAEKVRGLPDVVVPEETGSNPWKYLAERRQKRHDRAVAEMQQELDCIGREKEASVLKLQEFLQLKVMESDKKSKLLFEKIASDMALEGFSFEGLEELWNMIHQESSNRKKWVRAVDESLKEIERSRAVKIADVLSKYTVQLEEISFFLAADVHKLINDKAMTINRALLRNERATAKLLFNLMKSELEKEKLHQLKWQERVKDWKLIQKNRVVQSFREFMASEEIQNPPTVKTEMENMIKEQIVLSEQRLRVLQHTGTLLPPTHTKSEINEWYKTLENLNKIIDTRNAECVEKMRVQCELVQGKCEEKVQICKMSLLDMNICPGVVEIVYCDMLQMTEKLKHRFEEELEHMGSDFKEMAKQHEQHCQGLYSYVEEAVGLWDVHQLQLSQQEDVLQKKVDEYRWEQDDIIQTMKDDLDIILEKMKMASCEEELEEYLENALFSLNEIRTRNETLKQILMDEVMAYPKAIWGELTSYTISITQHFSVKEIFKQNLQGRIDATVQDQNNTSTVQTGLEARSSQPRAEQDNHLSPLVPEDRDSCQKPAGEPNPTENHMILAQEIEGTEEEEDGESIPHKSKENEHAEQAVSITQSVAESSKAERTEIAMESLSTASGNTSTVLGVEEAGKTDRTKSNFTKYREEESLPMYLKYVLLTESMFVKLKKRVRLCFFEHLEKWCAESLSNSFIFVAAKKEELNAILLLHLQMHQQKQEEIQTNIYNARAAELALHKERLECHCAVLGEGLKKEKAEFLKFSDQLNNLNTNFHSRVQNLEHDFLHAPVTEQSASSSNILQSELHNHLESIRVTVRSYQHHLEEALGKLRNLNVGFLKSCRLFSEAGDFSSEEVNVFTKCLQKESKQIDSFESSIKTDVKQIESSCLEQATELTKKYGKKFASLSLSQAFMEKVHQSLRQLRQQIKLEVANSNLQSVTLKSYLEKLQRKRDAYVHSAADKEALTSEELYDFAREVLKELKKRSQYLDCFLVKAMIPRAPEDFTILGTDGTLQEDFTTLDRDGMLQDSIAPAIQKESLRDESKRMVMGLDPDKFPLLNPSRMGTSVLDDLAVTVIRKLAGFDPLKKSQDLNQGRAKKKKVSNAHSQKSAVQIRKKSSCDETKPKKSEKKGRKSLSMEERSQLFGKKSMKSNTFKGTVMNILWRGNNTLLSLGEEFYGGKKNLQMRMPEDLPETFEHWAEMLRLKLLAYQRQTDDYYNFCLGEFRDQLTWFEEELSSVSQLVVESLLKEHEQKLSSFTAYIQHLFSRQLKEWEDVKTMHQRKLHYSLGHPDNSFQLEALCQEEIKRQKDQTDGVHLNTKMLQDCAAECAQSFFSALAALTEKLLLELDETITVDDIQVAETEIPREKMSTLIHPKQAGLPLGTSEVPQLLKRGRRSWPGIPETILPDAPDYTLCRGTASVPTAKTTLGHLAVVDARQAAYKKYKCKLEQMFAQIKEESAAQLRAIQRWNDWWEESIRKIKLLYI
ncbi:coiled-coil domain-containing protein 180 isoform X1 [Corvus kubaryi]|uniref:coiled-coil domain-containing protein 180 isoform X1 n=1 Tax=Corvus kubaryi TaxID=68294 RepID=UPI001C0491DE|nr:coiled-coil domain-containing protein 180 isoform X1 [Corvus kubaryi]XP_041889831.1 coiled-coil domain-containing protein 180 isoform X1 [Corvus kubaryi]XP_041889834.1 coiled-coil domain-containing protein 180 isoform X1 [Corvus kubaryi]